MDWKRTERIVAAAVFAYALVLYILTVAPTASFWDSGEFIAIAHGLQVSHPPGAPFYMLVGRLFSIVLTPIFALFKDTGAVALAINLVSVFASAATIWLTHLIIVRLVREWQGEDDARTDAQRVIALAGGVIGACTFAVTDSFWFNAVEAEVYALSMFFTAAVVWLIMRWSELAKQEEALLRGDQHPFGLQANRYLILIAYLFGLATGVHLLNLLAIFFIALIFFFTEYDRDDWARDKRWLGIVVTGAISAIVFLVIYPGIIQKLPDYAGRTGAPLLALFGFVALVALAVFYTHKKQWQVPNLVSLSLLMVVIGYSSYALIFIRSAADPPIDENDPETAEAIVSYLKREQYGATPLLKGASYNNATGQIDAREEKFFPRRYSSVPQHVRFYSRYDSDWEFFWKYQVDWMYNRYFMWNFVGRANDMQDAPWITGLSFIDGPREPSEIMMQAPSQRASRNAYFALPLLLGLLGMFFHFSRDWRRAFSVLILFFVTGIGIILYLNQTPMQPRERDYSYVASFFAFSLWVGIGATGVLSLIHDALLEKSEGQLKTMLLGTAAVLFLAVPGWMALENYDDHDRSGRYVAPEYAYNMLMSTADDAIIFTNGDNDTFPLWYLQEVEGIRRDVRVVNLSLLNTPWYVNQLKHQASRESAPLPISISDEQIRNLSVVAWEPREFSLPVDKRALRDESELFISHEDTSQIESPMRWQLNGRPYSPEFNVLYGADVAALNIIETNAKQGWERPIYFAVTVAPDGLLDLQEYFQLEGQAFRIVPIRHQEVPMGRIVPDITPERLKQFKFTNLDDPSVYYDENIRQMTDNYRNIFSQTAERLAAAGRVEEGRELLDIIMTQMPLDVIPADEQSLIFMAHAHQSVGDTEQMVAIMRRVEPMVLARLANMQLSADGGRAAVQFASLIRQSYMEARDFEAAAAFMGRIADLLGDDSMRSTPDELRREYDRVLESVTPPGLPPREPPRVLPPDTATASN